MRQCISEDIRAPFLIRTSSGLRLSLSYQSLGTLHIFYALELSRCNVSGVSSVDESLRRESMREPANLG